MTHYFSALCIRQLRLSVHLGVTAEEREQPQAVEMDARFYFDALPACALDDNTDGFICYDVLCNHLMKYLEGKAFRFVEYLTLDLHRVIREHVGDKQNEGVKIWIRLVKCNPQVPAMHGGAAYAYSDLPLDAVLVNAA